MITGLVKMICELGIFIVCAQTVCCFRPKAVYEKYLKFLVGIMILLLLMMPVSMFFRKENNVNLMEKLEEFYEEVEEGRKKALKLTEEIQEKEMLAESVLDNETAAEGMNAQTISQIYVERIEINETSDE